MGLATRGSKLNIQGKPALIVVPIFQGAKVVGIPFFEQPDGWLQKGTVWTVVKSKSDGANRFQPEPSANMGNQRTSH